MEFFSEHSTTNNSLLKILFTILFITLPFLGFFLGVKYQTSVTESLEVPTTLVRKPTPTPPLTTDMTNWKTFSNKEYMYEFKYPSNWSISSGENVLWIYDKPLNNPPLPDYVIEVVIGYFGATDSPYDTTINDPIGIRKHFPENDRVYEEKIANINIGGKQAVKAKKVVLPDSDTNATPGTVVRILMDGTMEGLLPSGYFPRYLSLQLRYGVFDDYKHQYEPQDLDKIFDQILSTFKFLDQNTPTPQI